MCQTDSGSGLYQMKSRVNPKYLTPEALKESASKIKWNEKFYHEFFEQLRREGKLPLKKI